MATNGLAAWFQEFVYYAGPIIQMLYWIVIAACAVWAVLLLKRLVDHMTRSDSQAVSSEEPAIDLEPFVE